MDKEIPSVWGKWKGKKVYLVVTSPEQQARNYQGIVKDIYCDEKNIVRMLIKDKFNRDVDFKVSSISMIQEEFR